jgi:hypothetical protein
MQLTESTPQLPVRATAPTMALLTYAWRFVLARVWMFAGLSGLLGVATVASLVVGRIATRGLGFHTSSNLLTGPDILVGGLINAVASAFIVIPIFAGIYGIVFRLLDNAPDPVMGFSVLQRKYSSVAAVSLIGSAANLAIHFSLWMSLGSTAGSFVYGLVSIVLGAMFGLALPALIRFDLTPLDAIAFSVRRFAMCPWAFIGYFFGASLMAVSGMLACGVGILFTLGVLIVAPALLLMEPSAPPE